LLNDFQFLTSTLSINLFTDYNTRVNEIGGISNNPHNSGTIAHSFTYDVRVHEIVDSFLGRPEQRQTQFHANIPNIKDLIFNQTGGKKRKLLEAGNRTVAVNVEVVERVDGAEWRASYGTMQPKALEPLKQLLADLKNYGVAAVMPTFVANLERLAGLTVDEAGG
jgi:hypothetical protein